MDCVKIVSNPRHEERELRENQRCPQRVLDLRVKLPLALQTARVEFSNDCPSGYKVYGEGVATPFNLSVTQLTSEVPTLQL